MTRISESQRARLRRLGALEAERDRYRAALERITEIPCVRDIVRDDADDHVTILHCFPDSADGPYEVAWRALYGNV